MGETKVSEGKGYKYSKINNKILLILNDSKAELSQLIINYKTNIKLQEEKTPKYLSLIKGYLDVDFAISIVWGRILNFIAMSHIKEKNKTTEIL